MQSKASGTKPTNRILDWVRKATRAPHIDAAEYIIDNWERTVGVATRIGAIAGGNEPTEREVKHAREVLRRVALLKMGA